MPRSWPSPSPLFGPIPANNKCRGLSKVPVLILYLDWNLSGIPSWVIRRRGYNYRSPRKTLGNLGGKVGKVAADLEAQLGSVLTDAIENRIATFVKGA